MIEIGIDSYVDVAMADNYVDRYYATFAPMAVHWSVLTDKEKMIYLLRSMGELEPLKWTGTKYKLDQRLAFPRRLPSGYTCRHMLDVYNSVAEVPIDIEHAQIENAIAIIHSEVASMSDKQFMTLQSLGAIKNTKYNKREAGDIGFGDELKGGVKKCPISSDKAYKMISRYIGGGYKC